MTSFNRRRFLIGVSATAVPAIWSASFAQDSTDVFYSRLREEINNPLTLRRIYTDVDFVHLWRAEIAPRGYENKESWLDIAQTFQREVFKKISEKPPAILEEMQGQIVDFDARAQGAYRDNIEAFNQFLKDIGIAPESRVALRLVTSLRQYLALAAAAYGSDANAATESSYFWPWC